MSTDTEYMRRCFELARRALVHARPNPAVGCVLVKDGKIIAEGFTQRPGEAHAEVHALQAAGSAARGATAYVSLEPCAHHGRTGPCSEALINAGIARVVFALSDPNPLVFDKGVAQLRAAGITVDGPLLPDEAEAINPGFLKRMRHRMPYVRMKMAMSLDARTAMASGESQWITGSEARMDVQQWRARSCAILSGAGTVLRDDPLLTVRLADYKGEQPLRVIVDSQLRTPPSAQLLRAPGPVLIAHGTAPIERAAALRAAATTQLELVALPDAQGKVDLRALLRHLAREKHCNEVLAETGATLGGVFMQAGLVDELLVYIAPTLLGSDARPLLQLPEIRTLAEGIRLEFVEVAGVGKDCRMRLRVLPR